MASRTNTTFKGTGHPTGAQPGSQPHQAAHQRQTHTFVNYQAPATGARKSKNSPPSSKNGGSTMTEHRVHPTMRLSHIQHNSSTGLNSQQHEIDMASTKKSQYHEAVSRSTRESFDEQLAKSFAMPIASRDEAQPAQMKGRPSLAATHPNLYHNSPNKSPPTYMQPSKFVSLSPDQGTSTSHPSYSLPPAEPPWRREMADPKWQVSADPHYWTRNRTVLKADASIEHGNVISPTWMIGLPFGNGMTELAEVYPADDESDV